MEVAERVAAAEAELAAVAREVADLEKRIRACRGRVLSKAPALAANSRSESNPAAERFQFRGLKRKEPTLQPHRDGPLTARFLALVGSGEEQRNLVEQWSAMFIVQGRRRGAVSMFAHPEDDEASVDELAQYLKRLRITTRAHVRRKFVATMSTGRMFAMGMRGRRRLAFLANVHAKRWACVSSRRKQLQPAHGTGGPGVGDFAESDVNSVEEGVSRRRGTGEVRPTEVPAVDWVEVTQTEYPALEVLLAQVGTGQTNLREDIGQCISKITEGEGDSDGQIKAMATIRKLLSIEREPPINEALHAGVLPVLVRCVGPDMPEEMLMEATWVITNICSGLAIHCQCVVSVGLVPRLIMLINEPSDAVAQQAAWALGNVAGDSAEHRDLCLKLGILRPLEAIVADCDVPEAVESKSKRELMRNVAWVCSNLMRGKAPRPAMAHLADGARWIGKLLKCSDSEVVRDAVWALSYIADGANEQIELLTCQPTLVEEVVELLSHPDRGTRTPALRMIGNIGSGSASQTQLIVDLGVLDRLPPLLSSDERTTMRKEAMWLVSNITAGTKEQIQAVLDSGLMPEVLSFMNDAPEPLRKEAVWAASNFTSGCDMEQMEALVELDFFEAMVQYTETTRVCIPQAIEGIKNALELMPDTGPPLFEALDGFARLAALEEMFHEFAGCHDVYRAIASFQSNS
eukprot:m.100408 g.100408  ORF g.100408 m.100408 type:complete len:688 (-) comp12489_c0_seq2:210-2273(-)